MALTGLIDLVERWEVEGHEGDWDMKRERVYHAKEAGLDAIWKGKYPQCTL